VRGERLVLPAGVRAGILHIENGRIARIAPYDSASADEVDIDAGAFVVSPGIVDTHVHINEPGRTHWEGFEHASRAAAAGGVTTVVDMPLNSIPATTSVGGFDAKVGASAGRCHVDVGFWGGVVPGNVGELEPLVSKGVLGFKCFLSPSGVDEFRHVTEADLHEALPVLAGLKVPLLAHAELPSRLIEPPVSTDVRRYDTWLNSRPPASECAAIDLVTRLARKFGAHVHIVHLAAGDALPILDAARASGAQVTVETCPHYLTFAAEDIAAGATAYKCAPPIRASRHREQLWEALGAGRIDLVASDHSPAPPDLKKLSGGDFMSAWGGIASLQLALRAVWTAASARGYGLSDIARWLCEGPARLAGLSGRKGSIAVGYDADLVIWDPDAQDVVIASQLQHRHPVTPYDGMPLKGRIHRTMLRGQVIFEDGRFVPPTGRPLLGRNS
jgi:allantoinase